MIRIDKLATATGIITSFITVMVSLVELPKNPAAMNVWLALATGSAIIAILLIYTIFLDKQSRKEGTRKRQFPEERRLRLEFPGIFAFVENIDEIQSEKDFLQFVSQLNHLLELERRARGIKWSEVKDIEAMKAIAYARLVSKRHIA